MLSGLSLCNRLWSFACLLTAVCALFLLFLAVGTSVIIDRTLVESVGDLVVDDVDVVVVVA
jgi:hypothetical protein